MDEKRKKISPWTIGLLIAVSVILFVIFNSEKNHAKQPQQAIANQVPLDPESAIRNSVDQIIFGKNAEGVSYLREVVILEHKNGYIIKISFNARNSLTENLFRKGIVNDMAELYIKLFRSSFPISNITISAYGVLTDQYGHEKIRAIYITRLTKEEAKKVNWAKDDITLRYEVIPRVWQTLFIHPAIIPMTNSG